jgi:hypothetical protein
MELNSHNDSERHRRTPTSVPTVVWWPVVGLALFDLASGAWRWATLLDYPHYFWILGVLFSEVGLLSTWAVVCQTEWPRRLTVCAAAVALIALGARGDGTSIGEIIGMFTPHGVSVIFGSTQLRRTFRPTTVSHAHNPPGRSRQFTIVDLLLCVAGAGIVFAVARVLEPGLSGFSASASQFLLPGCFFGVITIAAYRVVLRPREARRGVPVLLVTAGTLGVTLGILRRDWEVTDLCFFAGWALLQATLQLYVFFACAGPGTDSTIGSVFSAPDPNDRTRHMG